MKIDTTPVAVSGFLEAGPDMIFSGDITGNLKTDIVRPEWWGAVPDGATVCTDAFRKALAFIRQRQINIGQGGVLYLSQGNYLIDDTLTIDGRGVAIRGQNQWTSQITMAGDFDLFSVEGALDGSKAAYGFHASDFSVNGASAQPLSGAMFLLDQVQQMTIERVFFHRPYRAIHLRNCQGPLVKRISGCSFVAPTAIPAIAGSNLILLEGLDAVPGTGLTSRVYIDNCTGGGIGIETCVALTGCDVVQFSNNHFHGGEDATLLISSSLKNIYNIRSSNNIWEALNGYANYAARISIAGGVISNAISFDGDEFLNGAVSTIMLSGADLYGVSLTNCDLVQPTLHGVLVKGGKNINLDSVRILGGNTSANTNAIGFMVGDAATPPERVFLRDCSVHDAFGSTPYRYGIDLRYGTDVHVRGGHMKDPQDAIKSDLQPLDYTVKDLITPTGIYEWPDV